MLMIDYFEDYFLGRLEKTIRLKYAHKLWNLYETVELRLARTNNGLNGLKTQFGDDHVQVWKIFYGLQQENVLVKLKLEHIEVGNDNL